MANEPSQLTPNPIPGQESMKGTGPHSPALARRASGLGWRRDSGGLRWRISQLLLRYSWAGPHRGHNLHKAVVRPMDGCTMGRSGVSTAGRCRGAHAGHRHLRNAPRLRGRVSQLLPGPAAFRCHRRRMRTRLQACFYSHRQGASLHYRQKEHISRLLRQRPSRGRRDGLRDRSHQGRLRSAKGHPAHGTGGYHGYRFTIPLSLGLRNQERFVGGFPTYNFALTGAVVISGRGSACASMIVVLLTPEAAVWQDVALYWNPS
jgi:hypothetical protein